MEDVDEGVGVGDMHNIVHLMWMMMIYMINTQT